jgi:hypothetical protein
MASDRKLYFPPEEICAAYFFTLKNPLSLAGLEQVNLGSNGKHINH